ncbi:hypothetical protein OIU79_020188, partial [Salix purpurea]
MELSGTRGRWSRSFWLNLEESKIWRRYNYWKLGHW